MDFAEKTCKKLEGVVKRSRKGTVLISLLPLFIIIGFVIFIIYSFNQQGTEFVAQIQQSGQASEQEIGLIGQISNISHVKDFIKDIVSKFALLSSSIFISLILIFILLYSFYIVFICLVRKRVCLRELKKAVQCAVNEFKKERSYLKGEFSKAIYEQLNEIEKVFSTQYKELFERINSQSDKPENLSAGLFGKLKTKWIDLKTGK